MTAGQDSTVESSTVDSSTVESSTVQPSIFERGVAMRRRVLGDAHVDRAMAGASEFARPVQDLVTEYCWGAVWNRDGLDLPTRSFRVAERVLTEMGVE